MNPNGRQLALIRAALGAAVPQTRIWHYGEPRPANLAHAYLRCPPPPSSQEEWERLYSNGPDQEPEDGDALYWQARFAAFRKSAGATTEPPIWAL